MYVSITIQKKFEAYFQQRIKTDPEIDELLSFYTTRSFSVKKEPIGVPLHQYESDTSFWCDFDLLTDFLVNLEIPFDGYYDEGTTCSIYHRPQDEIGYKRIDGIPSIELEEIGAIKDDPAACRDLIDKHIAMNTVPQLLHLYPLEEAMSATLVTAVLIGDTCEN